MTQGSLSCGVIGQLRLDYYVTSIGTTYEGLLGGSALYACAGAAIWPGVSTELIAAVSSGFPSGPLNRLQELGIGTRFLIPSGAGDPKTFFAYDQGGRRHSAQPTKHYLRAGQPVPKNLLDTLDPGSNESSDERGKQQPELHPDMLPSGIDQLAGVHIAAATLTEELILMPRLRELGIAFISLDPPTASMSSQHFAEQETAIHGLDAFLPSESQARLLFQPNATEPREMAEAFVAAGCRIAVIKCGARGQILLDGESGQEWIVPAYPAEAQDVTGAGHAFCGGFLAGILTTGDPLEACLMGNVSASFIIEGSGVDHALAVMPGLPEARLAHLRSSIRSAA